MTTIILWLVALWLIGWVLWLVPVRESWAAIRQVGVGEWLLLVGLNGLVLLLLNGRWWLILRGLGESVSFWALFGYRLASFGVSYFTPGPHFGGEPVQVLLLEKEQSISRETAVASVALDKTIELLINFTFLVGGALFILQLGMLPDGLGGQTAVLGLLLLALPTALLWGLWRGKRPVSSLLAKINGRWGRGTGRLQSTEASLQMSETQISKMFYQSPATVLGSVGLSLLSWVGIVLEYGLSFAFLGIELSLSQMVLLLVAARVAILLPVPAGVGTLESSQILGLGWLGLETAVGLSIALVIRARDLFLGLIGVGLGWWKLTRNTNSQNQ